MALSRFGRSWGRMCGAALRNPLPASAGWSVRAMSTTADVIVPTISLRPAFDGTPGGREKVVDEIRTACEEIGFLTITDHDVPAEVTEAMWKATWGFFDLPTEEKLAFVTEDEAKYPYGYTAFKGEVLQGGMDMEHGEETTIAADLKECWAMGPYNPASGMPDPILPPRPAEFAPAIMAYYQELEKLSARLLSLMALALDLPENWFEDKIDRHRCALRLLNYPDLETPPEPGQIRASAHTDYGTVTILKPDDAPGGLQVLGKDEEWHDVPYIPGAYVINLGDLMARWTNDKWVSTKHRVVNPPLDASGSCRRQSVAFFHNINADHIVECIDTCQSADNPPKYPPVKAFDFLLEKHLASLM